MYLHYVECNSFFKVIKNNKITIIGVYENKCLISELYKGVLNKINVKFNKKIRVFLIEKKEYLKIFDANENIVYPITLVYSEGVKIKKFYGLSNYKYLERVIKSLKK